MASERRCRVKVAVLTFWSGLLLALPAVGCPFCSAVKNSLSEDFELADVVLIARLAAAPEPVAAAPDAAVPNPALYSSMADFVIEKVLKGAELLDAKRTVSLVFFGDARTGGRYLITGSDPQNLTWAPPSQLNERQHAYVVSLMNLPEQGPERLGYFQQYLQDSDPMLADDAYTEFARAPYSTVKQLKPKLNREQILRWIKDPASSASQRRLYLTLLGVCGSRDDLPVLEEWVRSEEPLAKSGLDALIACYLTLKGPAGVALIEDLYLKKRDGNFSGNYADVYAAIMALRFHGTEQDVVPRSRVLQAFSLLLDNPPMADLIIPDLARWEDWSHLEQLVVLFQTVDTKTTWVRMPIINYVRACPRPEAKEALELFRKVDPDAVQRALTFFPTVTK